MKKLLGAIAFASLTSAAIAAQPLVTPDELATLASADQVRVIDIRAAQDYAQGHIAGAVSAPYGRWRGPANNPGELPDLNKLTELVQSLGLTEQTHAIVVSSGANDTDFGAAARVYWTLRVLGLENLSILNGGVKAWQAAGKSLSTTPTTVAKSDFEPGINDALLVTQEQLVQATQAQQSVLVDARPNDFFTGRTRHVAARTPGTLQGAVNVEHSIWFKPGTSEVINANEAKTIAARYNLANQNQEIVSFCNTGHWAATNWFVLSELVGDKNVKLYAGSMVDWTQASSALPMDNVPGRFRQIMIDTKIWFDSL